MRGSKRIIIVATGTISSAARTLHRCGGALRGDVGTAGGGDNWAGEGAAACLVAPNDEVAIRQRPFSSGNVLISAIAIVTTNRRRTSQRLDGGNKKSLGDTILGNAISPSVGGKG